MSFAWPDSLIPQTCAWGIQKSAVQFRSPMAGSVESVEFPGSFWRISVTLPPTKIGKGSAGEAFFSRLAGGSERVLVPYWPRLVPAGTLRGSPYIYTGMDRGDLVLNVGGTGSLKAGDMIGVGNQLFQVFADCQDVAGAITVPIVNRVRAYSPSATPVIWYRPTVACLVPSLTSMATYVPGAREGLAVDLEEVA